MRSRAPEVSEALARAGRRASSSSCATAATCRSRPGVAETIDWARALHHLGTADLDLESAARTLGALVKYREDADRVKQALDQLLRA